jgi:DNA-binding response OmpR family regulator
MIYIIEDDEWMTEHLVRVLAGYQVKIFTNGIEAMVAIDEELPDLIILDIILDGPSGFALLAELQSYSDTSKLPVLVCTTLASEMARQDLSGYGVVAVLDKTTMTPSDLRQIVAECITAPLIKKGSSDG